MSQNLTFEPTHLKIVCINKVYKDNNLNYNVGKFFKPNEYNNIINFMSNDKKNNDKKINLILLKKIGKTTQPGKYKISLENLKKVFKKII